MWCKSLEVLNPYEALKEANMPDLKPCPFCGGKAEEAFIKRKKLFASMQFPYNTHYVYIRCKTCGATGKLCWTVENAIEAWNRRAGEAGEEDKYD